MKKYINKLREIETLVELSVGNKMTEEKAADIYALTNELMGDMKKVFDVQFIDKFNEAQEVLYDYFGFKEDWTVYPIDDRRKYWWELNAVEVQFYDTKEAYDEQDGNHSYSDDILYHRFYPKAVYEGAEFTMIMVDTHTDGNRFLTIYDNAKRISK